MENSNFNYLFQNKLRAPCTHFYTMEEKMFHRTVKIYALFLLANRFADRI